MRRAFTHARFDSTREAARSRNSCTITLDFYALDDVVDTSRRTLDASRSRLNFLLRVTDREKPRRATTRRIAPSSTRATTRAIASSRHSSRVGVDVTLLSTSP